MYRDSYGIKGNDYYDCSPCGDDPKASGEAIKYSKGKDYSLGAYGKNGRTAEDADTNQDWSTSDVLKTGLKLRQPI